MSFKTLKSEPRTFLAVIYDEQYSIDSGKCWALSVLDAVDQNEAAAKLAHIGGETLYGKDVEFFVVPKALAKLLTEIPRGIPIGDPNPLAKEMQDVIGEWLAVMLGARRLADRSERRQVVAVAPVAGGVIVAELTEDETQQLHANEQANPPKKTVH